MISLQSLQQTFEQRMIDMGCDFNRPFALIVPSALILLLPLISTIVKKAIQKNLEDTLVKQGCESNNPKDVEERFETMTNSREHRRIYIIEAMYITGTALQIIFAVAWSICNPPSAAVGFVIGVIFLAHAQFYDTSPLPSVRKVFLQNGKPIQVYLSREEISAGQQTLNGASKIGQERLKSFFQGYTSH